MTRLLTNSPLRHVASSNWTHLGDCHSSIRRFWKFRNWGLFGVLSQVQVSVQTHLEASSAKQNHVQYVCTLDLKKHLPGDVVRIQIRQQFATCSNQEKT